MMGRVALGTAASGVAATIDGGKDLVVSIRDGNTEKTVLGTIKTGAGAAMMTGVATANPPLIAGGAIDYGGAVVYESREAIGEAASYVGTKAYEGVSYAGGKTYEGASYVVGTTYDGATYVGGKAYDSAAYVGGKAYDGIASMGGWVTGWFGR